MFAVETAATERCSCPGGRPRQFDECAPASSGRAFANIAPKTNAPPSCSTYLLTAVHPGAFCPPFVQTPRGNRGPSEVWLRSGPVVIYGPRSGRRRPSHPPARLTLERGRLLSRGQRVPRTCVAGGGWRVSEGQPTEARRPVLPTF